MVICLGLALVLGGTLRAEEKRPIVYPFDVTVGGQKAKVQKDNILFVVIEKPVKPNAVVAIKEASALFVINAFPCKPDGTVLQTGAPAAVIYKQKAKEAKLSDTFDKKMLKPGTYLMNLVAHSSTSRVVFTVSEKSGDVKLPDFKKIVNFLKKGKK